MTATTSVPQIEWTPTGIVVPAEADILTGVQADMNGAFGGNLNQALNTPQGQLASSQTAIIADTNAQFAEFVNQVDPANASGFMQDAIGRIYFLSRNPALPTVVQAICVGEVNTPIPVGALIINNTDQNLYACQEAGVIPSGGSITLPFACTVNGPIACPANSVGIYQAISGWDSVSNPSAGVQGENVESPQDFEFRRKNSVALNAHGSPEAINAAVFNVANVIDVFVVDNTAGTVVDYGATNYPLAANSIYVGVVGGAAADVAAAIWSKKGTGCNYNGNTPQTVYDPSYSYPQPSYTVTFNIPTDTPIYVAVQLQNNTSLPADIVAQVQNAVIAAFTGADGGARMRMGGQVLASRFYGGIASIGPTVAILSVLIGTSSSPTQTVLTMGIDQEPTIDVSNITVSLV